MVRCLLGVCPGCVLDAAWVLPVRCGGRASMSIFPNLLRTVLVASPGAGPRGPFTAGLRLRQRGRGSALNCGMWSRSPGNRSKDPWRRHRTFSCIASGGRSLHMRPPRTPAVHVALPRGHLRSCCALRALARSRPAAGPCTPRPAGLLRACEAVLARGRGAGLGHHFLGRRRRSGPSQRANHSFRDLL